MFYYKFNFTGDYHPKEDGTHEVKLIQVDENGDSIAYCEGNIVPGHGTEITSDQMVFPIYP